MPGEIASGVGGLATSTATGAAMGSVVPGIGTVIGAGIGFIGGLASLVGGIFGASAASQAATARAGIMRQQAAEQMTETGVGISRKTQAYTQRLGAATASVGASGFQAGKGSSLGAYLGQVATAMKGNINWDIMRAQKTYGYQMQAAQATEDTGQAQAFSDIMGGVGGMMGGVQQAEQQAFNWWGNRG